MTADVKLLGTIHTQLANTYLRMVSPREEPVFTKDGEPVLIEGVPMMRTIYPSAAEVAAANAFLKQNNITAAADDGGDLAELQDQLRQRRKRAKPVLDFGEDFPGIQ